ncbi:Predicted heme/steroid binding protein [Cyclobacterium xiamenense]|uniref:Predicted heme/steroid binding protein n=2 Tax=Cyclobacterium xiamenense TaxID=1297121 RepID=A0A1H7BGM9_9BACT|nr:Predicted heme/steroid binding protein [Cyclobacterium xiamenense]
MVQIQGPGVYLQERKRMLTISKNELALRNGQDRPDIWIAFEGKIYDLGKSRLWKNGRHYEHWAGQDLTEELKKAPHTAKVFDKFKPIGYLK